MAKAPAAPGNTVTERPKNTALAEFDEDVVASGQQHETQFEERDKTLPRLKVLQGLSPQVTRGEANYNPEARVGMFIDTASGRLWEGETKGVLLIPVFYTRSITEWKPRKAGGGLIKDWKTDASVLERTERSKENGRTIIIRGEGEGHEIMDAARYYVMIIDEDTYELLDTVNAAYDLYGTQMKKAKTWNNFIDGVRHTRGDGSKVKPSLYYMSYRVTTIPEKNDQGNWMGVKIAPAEKTLAMPNGKAFWDAAKGFRELIDEGRVVVQNTDEGTEATGGAAPAPAGTKSDTDDDLPF